MVHETEEQQKLYRFYSNNNPPRIVTAGMKIDPNRLEIGVRGIKDF